MMARSKCSNQRPDTLMQDHSPPARRNHLQRTAGPYIWVNLDILAVGQPRPSYPQPQTYRCTVGAKLPATSCLGAFWTPVSSARGAFMLPASKNLHMSGSPKQDGIIAVRPVD